MKYSTKGAPFFRRYAVALVAAAGAMAVRVALMPLLGPKPPYITFFLGTTIAAAYGGMGPGLLVTFIGVVFGFFVLSAGPVVIEQEAARLCLYVLSGFGICLVAQALHRQRGKVQEQALDLQRAHDELELLVLERTEELRRKERLLEHQSRQAAMGEMINNIAHQWRQPLNALGLIIQSLPLMHDTGDVSRRDVEDTVENGMEIIHHMSQTIDDFREYFKPDREKASFPASHMVYRTKKLIEDYFKSYNISIEVSVPVDPVILGYPNQFSHVLLNILLNARDEVVARKVRTPKILIATGTENGRAVITIADNAGGIPESILDKIFEPYFTTKGPEHGTGIGLFMSKAIIEKMGGKISVRNIENGAEFRIEV